MADSITGRAEAQARGLKRYFTGKVCRNGHTSQRYATSGGCVTCRALTKKTPAQLKNHRAAMRRKRLADPAAANAIKYAWDKANPLKVEIARRKSRGQPLALYPTPLGCECCGRKPKKRKLTLDHDHKTGAFRGWLCPRCNTGIGMLGDNWDGVLNALVYLARA